ncbi:MAG TPA: 3D domain-containing protein, partial [Desulfobacteria bacterium]|nr:3D domain-containing protein [Desulfobacteria bacterium]
KPMRLALGSYDVVSRQGPTRGGRAVKFVATAYTYTGYRTATGANTRRGIVAVDPRVIPLGSRLYVEGYGYGVAADTGGAIKGRRIDVFLESEAAARKWGRRSVDVYISND